MLVFLVVTFGVYGGLKILKVANFQATSVTMVKIPLVELEYRVDPNPQAASVFMALAESDGLLADSYDLTRTLRETVEPICEEFGIPKHVTHDQREGYLAALRSKPDFRKRLSETAQSFEEEWKRNLLSDPMMAVGLMEISPEDIAGLPLHRLQESFKVKSKIALQTNITIVNEPFLNFTVTWDSPGAAAVLANVWGRLFVDRANDLTLESGDVTAESMNEERTKLQTEADTLRASVAEMESTDDYQKLKRADSIERLLYGSKNTFRMHGYVELDGEMLNEPGLIADFEKKKATEPDSATDFSEVAARIAALSGELQKLRHETIDFRGSYDQAKSSLLGLERIFGDRLTTTLFTHSRIKGGYYNPPMVFVERAIPSKKPSGPPKSILGLAIGVIATLAYLCWILYVGYIVPSLARESRNQAP
ncbi:MAG: hypothetical protein H6752_08675 [Candidatus Omnitrophica bacterium]|nr:hypothetical protein [Candidatus Omnitrophota bacterium]